MKFVGIKRIFSTKNEQQYATIGAFWDEMSKLYGRDNLMGLGCNIEEFNDDGDCRIRYCR